MEPLSHICVDIYDVYICFRHDLGTEIMGFFIVCMLDGNGFVFYDFGFEL